jgi:nuclear cap-binding protein subunit 2
MAEMLFTSHPFGIAEGVSAYLLQRKQFHSEDSWAKMLDALRTTKTIYVGNLSFYTTEEQIYELFARCGPVKRVVMGLNKFQKTPCGFCFVEYYNHQSAVDCKKHLSGTKLDDRVIRADLDPGFEEGRQYGRSQKTGGQIRDDHRTDYDGGRGGWGARIPPEQKSHFIPLHSSSNRDRDRDDRDGPSRKRQKTSKEGDVSDAIATEVFSSVTSHSNSASNTNSSDSNASNSNSNSNADNSQSSSDNSSGMDTSSSNDPQIKKESGNPRFREGGAESDED